MNLENNENSEAKCPTCGAPRYAGCEHSSNEETLNNDDENNIKTPEDPEAWDKALADYSRLVKSSGQNESKFNAGTNVNLIGPKGTEVTSKVIKTEKGIYLLELDNGDGTFTAGVVEENELIT